MLFSKLQYHGTFFEIPKTTQSYKNVRETFFENLLSVQIIDQDFCQHIAKYVLILVDKDTLELQEDPGGSSNYSAPDSVNDQDVLKTQPKKTVEL